MRPGSAGSLIEILAARKSVIIREWLARTLHTYPEHTSRFLSSTQDPFRNPVGHTLKEVLPAVLDELLGPLDVARLRPLLDRIVRLRAVQDFTPGQAVAFLFQLKAVLREVLKQEGRGDRDVEDVIGLEGRIDEMALLAFDLYVECRERMYEIREREARRRLGLLLKRQAVEGRTGETESRGHGDANPPIPDSTMPPFTDSAIEDCYNP